MGYAPIGVQFSGKPNDYRYANKRAEMYFEMVEWIRGGGQLPPIPELKALATVTYTYDKDRMLLEAKDQLKQRMGAGDPDHLDALALTFAQPVMPKNTKRRGSRMSFESNPYASFDREYLRA